ncbi:DUF1146 family protein [Caldalkalibacillus salinus]|uniref:DUF1146 family protein n=1 Tax=Caldalkalibacillus salinus TaxID=2803787 RepID=UPI00192294F2|nr:DUF1146 family protein [Caldalkalibacillus salinus]
MEESMASIGFTALLNMVLTIVLIVVSWWALQTVRFDLFLTSVSNAQAKILHVLLAVWIGHGVAQFFIAYIDWTSRLGYIF